MFDTSYIYHLVDHKSVPKSGVQESWSYNFATNKRRFLVIVERYDGDIYVLKYYADCHALSKNKYNLLLKDEQPAPIIRTCVNVMLEIFAFNPRASFGFIGVNSVNKTRKGKIVHEGKENTQRFRVYQTLMFNFFGQETFEHSQNEERSAYLLINRQNQSVDDFKARAEEMFRKLYLDLEEQ
jgi:hypothetical protein